MSVYTFTISFVFISPQSGKVNSPPSVYYDGKEPKEFASLGLEHLHAYHRETFSSISHVLETYYATKNQITRIRQKSADLRHIVQTALERARKKYALQMRQVIRIPRIGTNTKYTAN